MSNRRCALVTGASSNVGQGIAISLAKRGYDLAISYSENKDGADDTIQRCQEYGVRCVSFQAQLDEASGPEALIARVYDTFQRLDAVICNAGRSCEASILSVTGAFMKDIYNLDFRGYMLCAKAAAKYMIRDGIRGNIVFISSSQGEQAYAGGFLYCGIKAAVNQACKSIAMDLSRYGIRVNVVAPGEVRSYSLHPSPKKMRMHIQRGTPEKSFRKLEELNALPFTQGNVPMKRVGEPGDIGEAVAYLISQEASYITGVTLRVDGGLILPGVLHSEKPFTWVNPGYWKSHYEKAFGEAAEWEPKKESAPAQKHAVVITDKAESAAECLTGSLDGYTISLVRRSDYLMGIRQAYQVHGPISLLIVDCAEPSAFSIINATPERLDAVFQKDFMTYALASGAAARYMIQDHTAGSILLIIRNHGRRAAPDSFSGDAMNAAMEHAAKCMALDMGHYGIRVNCIAVEAKIADTNPANLPIQSDGCKQNISALIAFLAKEAAAYITGDTVYADYAASLPTAWEAEAYIPWCPDGYWDEAYEQAFSTRGDV